MTSVSKWNSSSINMDMSQRLFEEKEERDEISAMVGDTNLFLTEDGAAEAEIMIAEAGERGQDRSHCHY